MNIGKVHKHIISQIKRRVLLYQLESSCSQNSDVLAPGSLKGEQKQCGRFTILFVNKCWQIRFKDWPDVSAY